MTRLVLFVCLVSSLTLAACKKVPTTEPEPVHHGDGYHGSEGHHGVESSPDFEGREIVDNWSARTGDVTVCPLTGNKFEVEADSARYSYQGYTFVFCCVGECLGEVEANPGKYLDKLVEEAGGPASDPDPNEGGAIDDS